MSPDIGGLLKRRRTADHTTNALSNGEKVWADNNRIRCKWCQVQWHWNMHKLKNKRCHNIAETKAPHNFGTSYYFALFMSQHLDNTIILPITCFSSTHWKLSIPKHNPEYIIFFTEEFFSCSTSTTCLILYCK